MEVHKCFAYLLLESCSTSQSDLTQILWYLILAFLSKDKPGNITCREKTYLTIINTTSKAISSIIPKFPVGLAKELTGYIF